MRFDYNEDEIFLGFIGSIRTGDKSDSVKRGHLRIADERPGCEELVQSPKILAH